MIKAMSLSQKVALNTIVQIVAKAVTVIFGFLTMVILTRSLGSEGYGNYMYILTLVVLFGGFADWGTATIGVREAAKDEKRQNLILSNIFLIRLFLALLGGLVMILSSFYLPLKNTDQLLVRQGILFGSLILFLFALKASFGIIFQTKLQIYKLAIADITASILIFFLSWLFVKQNLGLVYLIIAVVLANVVAVALAAILAVKTIRFDFRFQWSLVKVFLKESLPMGAILLLLTLDNKIDTVMLGLMKGSSAVGIYAVAYRFYDVLILGAAYLMNSLLPVLSRYANSQKRQGRIKFIYQKSFDVLLTLGLLVAFLAFSSASLLVKLITQERFTEFFGSTIVIRILSLAIFLSYFNHLTGYTIVALGKQRWYFSVASSALVFNALANFFVIPQFSYYGAAIVTVLTEGLVLLITSFFVHRLIKVTPTLTEFPKTIVALIKHKGKIF
jgi:O-antigen/teichoic acid export membrane protein